jgi:hypothetical protein
VLAALIVIAVGILFILLGWFLWQNVVTEEAAPFCWIIGVILFSLGFLSLFNNEILVILSHYLPSF